MAGSSFQHGRLMIGTGRLYHTESSSDVKSPLDTTWSMTTPFHAEVSILPRLAWDIEWVVNVAGYRGRYPATPTAVKFIADRHAFARVVTVMQYVAADGIAANSRRGFRNLIIGSMITGEWNL